MSAVEMFAFFSHPSIFYVNRPVVIIHKRDIMRDCRVVLLEAKHMI